MTSSISSAGPGLLTFKGEKPVEKRGDAREKYPHEIHHEGLLL
jgi:hypothetical protein